jgi:hypothetical protein
MHHNELKWGTGNIMHFFYCPKILLELSRYLNYTLQIKHSWQIVCQDIMLTVNYFAQMHEQHFHHLNSTPCGSNPKEARRQKSK